MSAGVMRDLTLGDLTLGAVLRRFAVGAVAALALLAGGAAAQQAEEGESTAPDSLVERYGAWTVQCAAGNRGCVAFQQLSNSETGQRIVRATIVPAGDETTARLRLLVPLGPRLSDGVVVRIDETEPQTAPYLTCLQRGCVATTGIDEVLDQKLRAGGKMFVAVSAIESGRVVRFELSLSGISRAMDRLGSL
ncbi:MAG: invasion associated locus B family protein [Pseudomonadota bacterium]